MSPTSSRSARSPLSFCCSKASVVEKLIGVRSENELTQVLGRYVNANVDVSK